MQPYFKSAGQALRAIETDAQSNTWLDKVRTITPMQPLLAPQVDEQCQRVVYDALMRDRQLKLTYKKRDAVSAVVYESVHPLAVIQRGPLIYLVCLLAGYDDVRTLAMHRVQSAEMLYVASKKKAGFSIDRYIESGNLGVRTGEPIELKAVFARRAGEHLYETALSKNQRLVELADGRLELTATVPDTKELQWWLLRMGDGVEVLAPASLRDQVKGMIARMSGIYSGQAGIV